MKKSKILIPALSIASVGAVVTPMLTSCKSNNKNAMIDLFDEKYEAMDPIDKGTEKFTQAKAAEFYFGANNNKAIVLDDVHAYLATRATITAIAIDFARELFEIDLDATVTSAKASFNISKVDYVAGTNSALLAGKIALSTDVIFYNDSLKTEKYCDYHLEVSYDIKDVLYYLWWHAAAGEVGEYWSCGCTKDSAMAQADKNWRITRSYYGKVVYTDGKEVETSSATDVWRYDRLPSAQQVAYIGWDASNYLQNVHGKAA